MKERGRETIQGWFRNQSQPSRPILLATDFYDGSNANERTPARRERRRRKRKAGLIRLTIKPGKKRRVRGEDLGRRGGSRGDTKKEEEEEEKKEKGSGRKKLLLLLPPSHEPQTRKAKKAPPLLSLWPRLKVIKLEEGEEEEGRRNVKSPFFRRRSPRAPLSISNGGASPVSRTSVQIDTGALWRKVYTQLFPHYFLLLPSPLFFRRPEQASGRERKEAGRRQDWLSALN